MARYIGPKTKIARKSVSLFSDLIKTKLDVISLLDNTEITVVVKLPSMVLN